MNGFPAALERLTEQFARLPGIGSKTAQRLAFHVMALPEEDAKEFDAGDIIVCHQSTREMLPLLRKASAIILEDDDPDGQGVIVGMSLDIPVIIGAKGALDILKSGAVVTMNAADGTVTAN